MSKMYFDESLATYMSQKEENEKNYITAEGVGALAKFCIGENKDIYWAELGGGSHPDRYNVLFDYLKGGNFKIDWVDFSELMLGLSPKYLEEKGVEWRGEHIEYIEKEIYSYLENSKDDSFDLSIAKYSFDHLDNPRRLFDLLSRKLKSGGTFIGTLSTKGGKIKSKSTNGQFFVNRMPINGDFAQLEDGDQFTVRFYKESGNEESGFIKDLEVNKFYFSNELLKKLAMQKGFEVFIGDIDEFDESLETGAGTDVIVLRKK